MATVGTVTLQKDGKYVGSLRTLKLNASIEIVPVKKKISATAPDFMLFSKGVEIGAAWVKKGQRSGKDYVSCAVTDPSLERPLYFNLGKAPGSKPDDGVFSLIHNHQQNAMAD
jgi:uncharacterized protein (DUF736 family)